jgi:UPF0716 protein FxsA
MGPNHNIGLSGYAKFRGRWKWLVLFVGFPLLEVWLIMKLKTSMGWPLTLWLILMTGVIGGSLAHRQGFTTIQKMQFEMAHGRMPAATLVDGLFIFAAGLLLITPGMITDAIGFCLLIPTLRAFFRKRLVAQFKRQFRASNVMSGTQSFSESDDVIDV